MQNWFLAPICDHNKVEQKLNFIFVVSKLHSLTTCSFIHGLTLHDILSFQLDLQFFLLEPIIMSDEEEISFQAGEDREKVTENEFIDDEAGVSGDDEVSEDESDLSDQDEDFTGDEEPVDQDPAGPSSKEPVSGQEEEEDLVKKSKKRRKLTKNEFIDDEAELSGDEEISDDEAESSDDDKIDPDLVDQEAKELDSEEEEEVRGLYHKQLATEDRRAVLLLQEQLEEKEVTIGERRRRKFRWQTRELMENSLRRHYDPDDEDSQLDDEEDDEIDYDEMQPRLRRPTAESLLIGSTRITARAIDTAPALNGDSSEPFKLASFGSTSKSGQEPVAGPSSSAFNEDSNSNTISSRLTSGTKSNATSTINRFLYRDKEIVEALSTKEIVITSREEKDRNIQRELKRMLQSKSIFDQLYS